MTSMTRLSCSLFFSNFLVIGIQIQLAIIEPYKVVISYAPQGVEFTDGVSQGEAPKASEFDLYVRRTDMDAIQIEIPETNEYSGKAVEFTINTVHTGKQTVYYKPANAQDSAYSTVAPKNVGDYVLKVVVEQDGTYNAFETTKEFSIVPSEVKVDVVPVSVIYGDELPAFNGVVNAETPMAEGETAV